MTKSPKPPQAPKFYPIDIPKTLADAISFDVQGYNASDADFAARFPGLVAERTKTIEDAYNQLVGPLDPTVQNQFTQSAIAHALSTTGAGNASAAIQGGSAAQNIAGTDVAKQILSKQDYDRGYFQSLIESNPERAFGLSGADVANLSIANTGGLNANNQQQYASQLAGIAAQGAAGVQTGQLITGLGTSLASLSNLFNKPTTSDERLKENIEVVGKSSSGIPIVEFNYIAKKGLPEGRFRGVLAQDVLQIKPNAVIYHKDGYMTVDYTQIDVKHQKL